jgi:hypothetical protein
MIKTLIVGMNIVSGIVAFIASTTQTKKIMDNDKRHSYAAIAWSSFFSVIIIALQIANNNKKS